MKHVFTRGIAALFMSLAMIASLQAAPVTDKSVTVTMNTSEGTIVLELNKDKAPLTVANFLEYADTGYYDGTIIHRVIPGFMIQGGGFTPDMQKKSTRGPVRNESDNGLSNTRGTIAMARTNNPDSASNQFFY